MGEDIAGLNPAQINSDKKHKILIISIFLSALIIISGYFVATQYLYLQYPSEIRSCLDKGYTSDKYQANSIPGPIYFSDSYTRKTCIKDVAIKENNIELCEYVWIDADNKECLDSIKNNTLEGS